MAFHFKGSQVDHSDGIDAGFSHIQPFLIGRNRQSERDHASELLYRGMWFQEYLFDHHVFVDVNHGDVIVVPVAHENILISGNQRIGT